MGYKQVIINNNYKLKLKTSCLNIYNVDTEEEHKIPLEDIDTIVINSTMSTVSALLLSEIAKHNIALYICDDKQMPVGVFTPYNRYHRQNLVMEQQIYMTDSFKDRLWKEIIMVKIFNQGSLLKVLQKEGYKELLVMAKNVKNGDETNREAYGAKLYYKNLFVDFKRGNIDTTNIAMNYGYAILRGAISRSVVARGFAPSLGLHHCNQLNNYNLADDIIEVFRPFVDRYVALNITNNNDFTQKNKKELVNLLNEKCMINKKRYNISEAINIVVNSLYKSIVNKDTKRLLLPSLMMEE